ncbi:hypothetical protein LguiA_022493 [Lonicera macranthoides]
MPPKLSHKSKKLSQIEDNNELQLSLLQLSIPPPQPLSLIPLTDMYPPPSTFEIRDFLPRSSATVTTPIADTATALPSICLLPLPQCLPLPATEAPVLLYVGLQEEEKSCDRCQDPANGQGAFILVESLSRSRCSQEHVKCYKAGQLL